MGQSGAFSTYPLHKIAAEHEIVGIVESVPQKYTPFKAKLRSFLTRQNNKHLLKSIAGQMSVPFFLLQKGKKNGLASFAKKLSPEIICVASMSELLPREVFSLPPYGTINLHPALLPKYRGPRPTFWQYYFMESETGVTIHYIDEGEDTGNIIRQKSIPVPLGISLSSLANELNNAGAKLINEALEDIGNATVERVSQKHLPCPFRARRVEEGEALIDWDWPIERIWHFLRGTAYQDKSLPRIFPGLSWIVTELKKGDSDGSAGTLKISLQGFYMTHREGKIFFTLKWSMNSFLSDVYHFFLKLAGKD